jgi:hypothetical protein
MLQELYTTLPTDELDAASFRPSHLLIPSPSPSTAQPDGRKLPSQASPLLPSPLLAAVFLSPKP